MLSKDFITERGKNGADDDAPAAAPAQTPDWLKSAGNWLGKKIGMNDPAALPDYTASNQQDAAAKSGYTGIDPVQRQRAGMAPATQQEINRYMKANPAVVGGLTDRNGNPIASGGAQEVEKAARAAAPRRGADFDADAEVGAVDPAVIGNRFKTPNELGFQPGGSTAPTPAAAPAPAPAAPSSVNTGGAGGVGGGGQAPGVEARPVPSSTIKANEIPPEKKSFVEPAATGAAPTPMKGGYGSGVDNPSVAPKAGAAPATDAAAAAAADNASRSTVTAKDSGDKGTTPLSSEAERMQQLAGITPQPRERVDRTADIEAASKPAWAGQTDEFGGMESPAAAQSANDGNAGEDLAKIKANAGLAQSANDGDAGEAQAAATAAPAEAPVKAFVQPEAPAAPAAPEHNPEADLDPAIMRARFDQEAAERAKPPAATPLPVRPGQQTSGTFGQQFKSARDQGLKTFSYQGKSYSTAMKGETPVPTAAAKPAAAAPPQSRSAAPAPAAPAPAAPASAPAAKPLPAPQTGAAGQAARAASGQKPAPVLDRKSQSAVMESQEINRMRFLAGLTKD